MGEATERIFKMLHCESAKMAKYRGKYHWIGGWLGAIFDLVAVTKGKFPF
jgi:hypothetical protein